MNFRQDDSDLILESGMDADGAAHDERRAFARHLPVEEFFNGGREKTFASLGRVAVAPQEIVPWKWDDKKKQQIENLISEDQSFFTNRDHNLASADLLAFAAEGSRHNSEHLSEAIRFWWQAREHSPIWNPPRTSTPLSPIDTFFEKRIQKLLKKILAALGFSEAEAALFKTERFSRRTVYTRDYAAIPKKLRAIFNMTPQLIFTPRTVDQLKRFLDYASQNKINIAPRGRGTWALGGALLTKGGVVLEMASFEKKIEVDAKKRTVTVSASVDFNEAEEALSRHNLTLQVRPSNKYGVIAGFISVGEPFKGGLGLNAFGFGHIRDSVESIRVVSSAGEEKLVEKSSPDFDYYFGSNGRFGVISEVTLKARPKPAADFPVVLNFNDSQSAFLFLQALSVEVKSGRVSFKPVHVEFFGKAYLEQIKKIKSEEKSSDIISPESIKSNSPARDSVLLVFDSAVDRDAFVDYAKPSCDVASHKVTDELWSERFAPMKLRKKGDLLTAEVILPLSQVDAYLKDVSDLAEKLGIEILPVAYILNSDEALALPQYLTDRRLTFQYYRHFSLAPVLARRAIKKFGGRPYGFGIWFAGLSRRALGVNVFRDLKRAKERFDPAGILNPGKLTEIRSRVYNILGKLLLHERSIDLLDLALRIQSRFKWIGKVREKLLSDETLPYVRENGDALHRCIKCSACMICPLAQIWEKSGDPKLQKDAIYITPRFKMEFMQQHLFEGKKLSQEDVDRFVLCFRCGVAERETVCPISDMLLEVENGGTTACQKKLPTYDDFEARLRKEGYDVDGAIARYMDILKTHPGVAVAMKEVLGNYRVPKEGDLTTLQPKTDFAIYKVEVDHDRCINCGKCGDEHTTSQRGFWDPRHPRQMVSLDDLLRELDGKIPKSWFNDAGGPIPKALKLQGRSNGEYVYFPTPAQIDLGHQHCNGCLYCVIECPVDAIRVNINDYYVNLAGEDFTREDVRRINEEARTGGVPTSGTGSTGLFGGKGFDRYMFDFSVIVRPTRDGIREAIDIGVNLGRKPLFHLFEEVDGSPFPRLKTHFNTLDLPTPILLELSALPGRKQTRDLASIFARTAHREGTILILDFLKFIENFDVLHPFASNIGLRLLPEEIDTIHTWRAKTDADKRLESFKRIPLIEFTGSSFKSAAELREIFSSKLVVSNLIECEVGAHSEEIAGRVLELANAGAEIIHLNCHFNPQKGYHDSADHIQVCYEKLLGASLHTQVSLIANGIKSPADLGIAMMLGASALVLDRAALAALNHEFPMLEKRGEPLPEIEPDEGVHRLQNLFKSWHKQIQEVLGAFGVRDIRRTVGETGRLIDLRQREQKMRAIVEDEKLRQLAISVNEEKIKEDGELAKAASWKYSELSKLVKVIPPPNANLLGDRKASLESMLSARGDRRWNADVLTATWMMASGAVPSHKVPQTGADLGGGSFDCTKFAPVNFNGLPAQAGKIMSMESAVEEVDRAIRAGDPQVLAALDEISISAGVINKHRRPECEPYVNHFPIDAADMSLGSIGWKLTLARYLAGATLMRFTGTGEGGFPLEKYERLQKFFPNLSNDELRWLGKQLEYWVATQTATGYFGVNEDTIRRVRKIVLKFAQGAKPGLGGHILGAKVTSQVEDLRGVIAGISVFSPFPFHDVYSIEDVTKMLEWLRTINPDAIITVKISTPVDVYHVALGLVTGGADEIQIDATAGGTGAAPDIARNRIAMPLEYGLSDVHKFLVEQGVRNQVTLVASGGIRSAYDMAKALILGADKVILGTQEIVAQQCNRCGNCEAPGGCQKGITTTVEQLEEQKEILLNAQWLINTQVAVMQHVMKMMYVWGVKDIRELRGRTDLIADWGWQEIDDRKAKSEKRKAESEKREAKSVQREKRSVVVGEWDKSKEEASERDACGVVSFACTKAVPVKSIQTACQRMHNRGNGRGGGILALGGIFAEAFEDCYAFQIIVLTPENERRQKMLEIAQRHLCDFDVFDRSGRTVEISSANLERFRNPRVQKDGRDITFAEAGLAVDPGDMYRFFVRVKKNVLLDFAQKVLDDCRLADSERKILANGHPRELLQNLNIAGKWIDYFVKYFDVLTDDYLDSIDPDSKFWEDPDYQDLWRDLEDEFIYRRAFEINQKFYIEPQNRGANPEAFVASMMKDGGIWKLVGYAEQAADYWIVGDAEYVANNEISKIEKRKSKIEVIPAQNNCSVVIYNRGAHIWIGHQRFPTVFSPYSGGSHPFYGRVYEALIHNGDFANYVAMVRFWDQFGGAPQFRTDTEMAAKAYSILKQMGYPQTHLIEAIAPTTGIDLQRLKKVSPELAADFEAIQKTHVGGSPDGPWFFIIGDQDAVTRDLRIIGLTDTSVLRPSVFVWQQSYNGKSASIGLVGSEEQACRSVMDALYHSGVLASNEPDRVRIVRGGSVEQDSEGDVRGGGSLIYHLRRKSRGQYGFEIADKFGNVLPRESGVPYDMRQEINFESEQVQAVAKNLFDELGQLRFQSAEEIFRFVKANLKNWEYNTFRWLVEALAHNENSDSVLTLAIESLTLIRDRMQSIDVGADTKKRASLIQMVNDGLNAAFDEIEFINKGQSGRKFHRVTRFCYHEIPTCSDNRQTLVVDASGFPAGGHDSLARALIGAYEKGWQKFIVYKITGQRYLGAGFGPNTQEMELHLYGSPGQDIGNSLMGGAVHVHADAQNDMAKIIHSGTVVVHGLAGNTGVYGAKGGEIFVRDNVGTRWVINSVSSPTGPGLKVVIVGSAMEYLAESLMGGMVLMLGLEWDEQGVLRRRYLPFAGNSILAGASAGKVIIYDPDDRVSPAQFANALDVGFLSEDWVAVYRNLANLVERTFTKKLWEDYIERWRSLARYTLKSEDWPLAEKQDALDSLLNLLSDVPSTDSNFNKLTADARALKSLIEERFTGKEWRTLVRQFGQIVSAKPIRYSEKDFDWKEGIELMERMMDWKEVVELLIKADRYFSLGLTIENGWLYLPINGEKTEIKRAHFKVLRPLKPDEKKKLDEAKLARITAEELELMTVAV